MLKRTIYDEEHEIFHQTVRKWAEAKLFTSEVEGRVVDECVQLRGGVYGRV